MLLLWLLFASINHLFLMCKNCRLYNCERHTHSFFDMNVETDKHSLRMKLESKDEEIKKLTEQLYQVMRMNTNWQRYNDQREVKDQERDRERAIMIRQLTMHKDHIQMSERKIMDMKSSQENVLKTENIELKAQLELKEAEIQKLKAELKTNNQSEESMTMIEFLRQQVNVYVEDFRKERKDREAVQEKYESTRLELLEAKRTIDKLTLLNKQDETSYPYRNWETTAARSFEAGMRSRGIDHQGRLQYNGSGLSDDVEIDAAKTDDEMDSFNKDDLQCPACFKSFSFNNHHLLVEHLDTCGLK
ncbi:uncharacterized protein [Antedon mediterranea]|uniref:uncharacterized protein isoform X2 n=1 Tax=Antedon mediterranea TaxID=105859 RepID=UPI003AF9FAF2